jgi:hypothetical protein
MSHRPGYEEMMKERGREAADAIFAAAEFHSDAGHQRWDEAVRSAALQYDLERDPETVARHAANNAALQEIEVRRGDDARAILRLALRLTGEHSHVEQLARAEAAFDEHRPPHSNTWGLGDWMQWATEVAATLNAD